MQTCGTPKAHQRKYDKKSIDKEEREKMRIKKYCFKTLKFDLKTNVRDFLAFQWLRPLVFNAGNMGLIPGWITKIPGWITIFEKIIHVIYVFHIT